ncbi:conserved hypothetical protein [Vibrio chagasii]|nr:conserved hypothetical protein [Vibrio chagasii]
MEFTLSITKRGTFELGSATGKNQPEKLLDKTLIATFLI